jgi:hypothetical protein
LSLQDFAQFATHLQFAATLYNLTTARNVEEFTFTFSQKTGRKTTKGQPTPVQNLATKPQKSESIKTHQSKSHKLQTPTSSQSLSLRHY